jgi:23S rRNA-/tRNA-specific pseudouridylate synthase
VHAPHERGSGNHASPRLTAADVVRRTADDAVLLKPPGMSSEAPGRNAAGDTLVAQARMLRGWPDAQVPHRLDRPTRGFVVVARDRAAVARCNEAIRQGAWTKHYLARVAPRAGVDPRALVGVHKAFLRREGQVARVVRSGGDPSRLEIEAAGPAPARPGEWHLLVRLDTGRYHQIRAMCANLGIPLVGDDEDRRRAGVGLQVPRERLHLRLGRLVVAAQFGDAVLDVAPAAGELAGEVDGRSLDGAL